MHQTRIHKLVFRKKKTQTQKYLKKFVAKISQQGSCFMTSSKATVAYVAFMKAYAEDQFI